MPNWFDIPFEQQDFIQIEPNDFTLPVIENPQIFVFTSQNAVGLFAKFLKPFHRVVCVGFETEKQLKNIGVNVLFRANHSKELGRKIIEYWTKENLYIFTGNRRRDELFNHLKTANIPYRETQIYCTILTPKKIEKPFEGVVFFSPSGVESYVKGGNSFAKKDVFCIGGTTAKEVSKYTENYHVSPLSTTEELLKFIKHLKT